MSAPRIKVLFAIGTLDVGGAERQLVELASGLDRRRFEAVVCALAGGGPLKAAFERRGVRVHTFDFRGFQPRSPIQLAAAVRVMFRFWRLMRRERPDIFHGMLFWAYISGTVVARAARVPAIVASRRSLGTFKADKRHYLLLERLTNRLTDLFIANSEAVRADAVAQEGLDPAKVLVIYNGLDASTYAGRDGASTRAALQTGNGPVVVLVSNFLEYKGHRYFFEAWRDVVRRVPSAVAVLVGDGPTRAHWQATCEAEGLGRTLRFVGTTTDVAPILAAADLFVHPSLQEGCSNAILEAMAAGLPVIAAAVGGNGEAVDDGRTGVLVPARDSEALATAMLRLLGARDVASALGAAGREKIRDRFQLRRMIAEYEHVYDRLFQTARQTGERSSHVWNRRSV